MMKKGSLLMEADGIINIIQFKFKFHPGTVPYISAMYCILQQYMKTKYKPQFTDER